MTKEGELNIAAMREMVYDLQRELNRTLAGIELLQQAERDAKREERERETRFIDSKYRSCAEDDDTPAHVLMKTAIGVEFALARDPNVPRGLLITMRMVDGHLLGTSRVDLDALLLHLGMMTLSAKEPTDA